MRLILYPLLLCSIAPAQGARIFIVTDLEGAGGVNDRGEQLNSWADPFGIGRPPLG